MITRTRAHAIRRPGEKLNTKDQIHNGTHHPRKGEILFIDTRNLGHLHTIAEGSTSTYPSLKPSDVGSITFPFPPEAKLREFAIIANNTWEKIENNHIQIRTLETLRDTLLPKLMSGEVRVVLGA